MFKNQNAVDIIKFISIVLLLALPPWIEFRSLVKEKLNELILILIFIVYAIGARYTENIFPFILVVIIFYLLYKSNRETNELYYLRPLGTKKWDVLVQSIYFKIIITIINMLFILLIESFGIKLKSQEVTQIFLKESWLKTILLIPVIVIIAPILEEYVFRHFLYRKLSNNIGKFLSAILTSILFMILHFNIAGAISFFGVGLYNCYLYEKYGYRASLVNHFMFNFTSVILMVAAKAYGVNLMV